ncbi:MAG: 9-O-acetylesterase, partial [Kiritimatiellae bacterium]|nr:9-O-acetylesterase [Kiritimatiellia bacterium]
MKRLSVLSLAALCALSASAAVKFASPFGDGMVLQRGKPVAVWGTADAGEKVDVTFAGQSASATAGADGRWLVRLAPMEASAEGRVLKANGAEVKDVLVGEVWLCSGQSNMSMRMWTPTKVCQHGNRDNNGYL